MHDWTRVSAGTFHDFHNSWITHLKEALNASCLPEPYYALGEQRSGDFGSDVLVLRTDDTEHQTESAAADIDTSGLVAVADAPPQVRISQEAAEELSFYLLRQRHLTIRRSDNDRVVALVEIVSPANRHSLETLNDLTDKIVSALKDGIHVLVIDPLPPGRHDPDGIHGFIWERLMAGNYEQPSAMPLTLVSYCARHPVQAWVDPLSIGDVLADMPMFLTPGHYVTSPLEETYMRTWAGVPQRWKRVILGDG